MIYKEIELTESKKAGHYNPENPAFLQAYLLSSSPELINSHNRRSVIVCPGGAYRFTSDREAEPVAMRFLAAGFQTFVLRYSVGYARYPQAFVELAEAVQMVRSKAKEWDLNSEHIYICGFSAGGHLCSTMGTKWKDPILRNYLEGEPESWRPSGMILGYPVITAGEKTHRESIDRITDNYQDQETIHYLSNECQVSSDTVRTFIWSTTEDTVVPAENSLMFAAALQKAGVPYELHIYEKGEHGASLCDETTEGGPDQILPDNAKWINLAIRWMKR